MPPVTETERDLQRLEAALRQLEAEYHQFFAGRLPRPPWETRSRVAAMVKQFDRAHIPNAAIRFRFTTLQSRYASFIDLCDRGLRAREEGRPGPFTVKRVEKAPEPRKPQDRVMQVAAIRDPQQEPDKIKALYESLVEARREVGEDPVPFSRFAELVKTQVQKLRAAGHAEVAFRVAVKDGKVNFTARAIKGADGGS
jgi:hypothetical protein